MSVRDGAWFDLSGLTGIHRLELMAIDGSRLLTLPEFEAPGQIRWDGRDVTDRPVPSGIYLLKATSFEGGSTTVLRFVVER